MVEKEDADEDEAKREVEIDMDTNEGAGNFKARTIFFDFQNAGRQDARWESITGDDSLTEYNTQFVC